MPRLPHAFALLATGILALPALAQTVEEANVKLLQPGDSVPVTRIPEGVYLRSVNDPDDIIWERLPEYRVHMVPAPAVHPSVELRVKADDPGYDLYFNVARTSERMYFRLRWRDASMDDATTRDKFRDGAAVEMAVGTDDTSYLMGSGPEAPVNIWYWSADGSAVQNLAAGGYGSLTPLDTQSVSGDARYQQMEGDPNQWQVVMSRPLPPADKHEVSFDRPQVPVAFAVWQGSDGQRDGLKSVSEGWILARMEN